MFSYSPWHFIKTSFSLHTDFKFQISWVPFTSLDVTGDTPCMPVNICFSTSGYSVSKLTSICCLGFISTNFIYMHINSNLFIINSSFLISLRLCTVFITSFFDLNFTLYKHLPKIFDSVISLKLINFLYAVYFSAYILVLF